jgi:protein-tyrosine phosphatase
MADYGDARGEAVTSEPAAAAGGDGVLVLCTANVCRSPMAAALLARRLATLGVTVPVSSAGMLDDGRPALPEVVQVMDAYGLDVSAHRSRAARPADLAAAGLVLGMARENIRHAVVTAPEAWPRAFTVKELIRRAGHTGARAPGEPLPAWLSRVHAGRERASLLGDAGDDDVPDPAGGPPPGYAQAAALLDQLMDHLAWLCWGQAGSAPASRSAHLRASGTTMRSAREGGR